MSIGKTYKKSNLVVLITFIVVIVVLYLFRGNLKKEGLKFFYINTYTRIGNTNANALYRKDVLVVKNFENTINDFSKINDYIIGYIDTINIKKYIEFTIQISDFSTVAYWDKDCNPIGINNEAEAGNESINYYDEGILFFYVFEEKKIYAKYYNSAGWSYINFSDLLKK